MIKIEFDLEQLESFLRDCINQAIEKLTTKNALPPLLTRDQLKDFFNIGDTKASELLNRKDFPVLRVTGHPRVPTHLLFKWIEDHTEWDNS